MNLALLWPNCLTQTRTMAASNQLATSINKELTKVLPGWIPALKQPAAYQALKNLNSFIVQRLRDGATIYPHQPFRALELSNPEQIKVVILGQDPYHGPGQAQGLAFSVPNNCACPPSLRNIFNELTRSHPGKPRPNWHDLTNWARQGVLLLNTSLTVEEKQPQSHANKGWEEVTDALILHMANTPGPRVYMLWGAHAQRKQQLLSQTGAHHDHLVLTANHPSPLSANRPPKPFIGCNHFVQANQWLESRELQPIDWFCNHARTST